MNETIKASEGALPHVMPARRRPEDTSAGCRAKGDADLERAQATVEPRMRMRMETSAGTWFRRADMLDRLEQSFLRRGAAAVGGDASRGAS